MSAGVTDQCKLCVQVEAVAHARRRDSATREQVFEDVASEKGLFWAVR